MKRFIIDLIVIAIIVGGGLFVFLGQGYFNTRADVNPSPTEKYWAMRSVDAWVERNAPGNAPNEANPVHLKDGMTLYLSHCAGCHSSPGAAGKDFGRFFYPPAPNFIKEAPDMPENQNFYIIKHGIRWSGMPAWGSVLTDDQIWEVAAFLSHLDNLPPAVQQQWEKPAAPGSQH
jgi:mono/diheme cytochrome c family protein